MNFSVYIYQQNNFIDVTNRKMIIWGAGNYVRYAVSKLQFCNIGAVIDSNINIVGSKVMLCGEEYTIKEKDYITTLHPDTYYIFIGTINYKEEIVNEIREMLGKDIIICDSINQIFYAYNSLHDMFCCDPHLHEKISNANISMQLPFYIERIEGIIKEFLKIDYRLIRFMPILEGFRVSFLIYTNERKFVVHIPVRNFHEAYTPSDRKYIKEAYLCKKMLSIDREITVYEDEFGIEIEHFAQGNLIWNAQTVTEVLHMIRDIHEMQIEGDYRRDPWDKLVRRENLIKKNVDYFPEEISNWVHCNINDEVQHYRTKICHGDFHVGNFLIFNGKMVITDWEWIGFSDPAYDICQLVNSLEEQFPDIPYTLEKALQVYYCRKPSEDEIRHIKAVSILELYERYCTYIFGIKHKNDYLEERIKGRIADYAKCYLDKGTGIKLTNNSKEKVKISVVTVSLNSVKTIEKTIRSVMKQNYDNIEYIIIDGGSTDGTTDIIRKYSDFISYWISEPDNGLYDAMNKGMKISTGDYINFLNSDDWYQRDAINNIVRHIEESKADVVFGNVVHIYSDRRVFVNPRPLEYMYWCIPFNHQATFMRNTKERWFDTRLRIAADYKMLYEMYMEQRTFHYAPYTVANFSVDGLSSDLYTTACEVAHVTAEGLLKQPEKIALYRPYIIQMFIGRENYHRFLIGENHERIVQFIRQQNSEHKEVVFFGTGDITHRFWDFIKEADVKVRCFIDNDTEKIGNKIWGYDILPLQYLCDKEDINVCVMSDKYWSEMLEQLDEMDLPSSIKIYDYVDLKRKFIEQEKSVLIETGMERSDAFKRLVEWVWGNGT